MNAIEIDNNEIVTGGRLCICAALTTTMTQLNTQSEGLERGGFEEVTVPSLKL